MVNQQVLKEQVSKAPPNMTNGGEIFKHIFTAEPNLRKYWGMEDIDPEQVVLSRQMQQKGAGLLSNLNNLVNNLGNEKSFKLEIFEVKDTYKETGLKAADFKKLAKGVTTFFETKVGKLSDSQKRAWVEFFDKFSVALREAGL